MRKLSLQTILESSIASPPWRRLVVQRGPWVVAAVAVLAVLAWRVVVAHTGMVSPIPDVHVVDARGESLAEFPIGSRFDAVAPELGPLANVPTAPSSLPVRLPGPIAGRPQVFVVLPTAPQSAEPPQASRVRLVGDSESAPSVDLPLLRSDYRVTIAGDIATVRLRQRFGNPTAASMHARYEFPLDHGAAVHAMTMEIGNERIRAEISRKEQAQRTFEAAKAAGKTASLLTQSRPNVFVQRIANLPPGVPVDVILEYSQIVRRVDGAYELVIPTVVGPRYTPAAKPGDVEAPAVRAPVAGPSQIDPERVGLELELQAGLPIRSISSPTHALRIDSEAADHLRLGFAAGRVIDNRDFVLRYRLAGKRPQAGLLRAPDGNEEVFSVLIEAPDTLPLADAMPRELVFLLDCSGSMSGPPMEASKSFMAHALKGLRPDDSFRIIRFSDAASEFSPRPLRASPENVARGLAFTSELSGTGGTVMTSGIERALGVDAEEGRMRIVVFLTDGYIGNDAEVIELVRARIGKARIYALGVGAGVNRYLLDEVAAMGRGMARYLDPTRDVDSQALELARRIDLPVLTDLRLVAEGFEMSAVTPAVIPDLFAGQSVRVTGRLPSGASGQLRLMSAQSGDAGAFSLPLDGSSALDGGRGVVLAWARAQVRDELRDLARPRVDREAIESRVTELGLHYSLVTPYTAFVAVSERVYAPAMAGAPEVAIAAAPVAGTRGSFGGHGAPEPELWIGLATLLAVFPGLWWLARS